MNPVNFKGMKYAIATLLNTTTNAVFENVTIFGSHPNFAELRPEAQIEGVLTANDYNGKKGWKFQAGGSYPKKSSGAIAQAMKSKQEGIEKTMDRKEEAIQKSSIIRDSTLLTVAAIQGKVVTTEETKEIWENWQKWLETKWSNPF
jgi:hypothetical protein